MPWKLQKPHNIFYVLILGVIIALIGFAIPDQNVTTILYIIAALFIGVDSRDREGENKLLAMITAGIMIVICAVLSLFLYPNDWNNFYQFCIFAGEIVGIEAPKP